MNCRHCNRVLKFCILDLGFAPPSNNYITKNDLDRFETYFPLRILICESCFLVQTADFNKPEDLFSKDYAYLSSTSKSWLKHSKEFVQSSIDKFSLTTKSFVIEIGSNDGYLLKNFVAENIPCIGVEPTSIAAASARQKGINVVEEFFTLNLANRLVKQNRKADLVIINNVLAHVPNLNDFVLAVRMILKRDGVLTIEIPHILNLVKEVQFDTIYHEHYSYFSFHSVKNVLESRGFEIFDVERIKTHGGSLRLFACQNISKRKVSQTVSNILRIEDKEGMNSLTYYKHFQEKADQIKNQFVLFLLEAKKNKKSVAGYGAAAKGNTLLNYAGIKPDLLPVIYDSADSKYGKYLPGSHIPIKPADMLVKNPPDYLIIFPWNLKNEIIPEYKKILPKSLKFITFIPKFNQI